MTRFIRGIGPAEWTFRLPVPPSLNGAYATITRGGRPVRVPSRTLAKFKRECAKALHMQKRPPVPIAGPVSAHIWIERQRGDLDNRIKAALDAIVSARIISDDKNITRITAEWGTADLTGCTITIEVLT